MHQLGRQGVRRRIIPIVAMAVGATSLIAGTTAASGQSVTAGSTGALNRTVVQRGSHSFPTGQTVGSVPQGGIAWPELAPSGSAAAIGKVVNRSHTARPSRASAQAVARAPQVAGTNIAGPKGLNTSFKGLNFFDQRFANGGNQFSVEPPDQGLCVGEGQVFETVNDVLQVFTSSGVPATPPTDLNSFYGYPPQVNRTTGKQGPFLTDPSCYFDPGAHRFIHVVLTLDVNPDTGALLGTNHLDIAVSKSANPAGKYVFYSVPVQDDGTHGTPTHTDCPCIGDYPHIGADANGFYITTNEYPFGTGPGVFGNNFNGAQLYAFPKSQLAHGAASIPFLHFQNLAETSHGQAGFTVWPANSQAGEYATVNNGTEYFMSSNAAFEANGGGISQSIVLWGLRNTASLASAHPSPVLEQVTLGSEIYAAPPRAQQAAGSTPLMTCIQMGCRTGIGPNPEQEGELDSNDTRMQQTWFAGGNLYGALDTAVTVVAGGGFQLRAGIAFFVLHPNAKLAASTSVAQGYVGVPRADVTYPAIAALASGKSVMAFTLTGDNIFPSAAYLTLGPGSSGQIVVAGGGAGPQDGFTEYNFFSPTNDNIARPRWGDYGAAVAVGGKIWIASEDIEQTCSFENWTQDVTCGRTRGGLGNWATRISRVTP